MTAVSPALTPTPPSPSRSTQFLRFLLLLLLAALILLLVWPVSSITPTWLAQLHQGAQQITIKLAPYLLVGLLGGIVGVAELTATFKTYPREALKTRWSWVLIGVNAIAAVVAMLILRASMPTMSLSLQVITVGLGFQSLIRTRFVLAKQIGADGREGEVAVNLGWLYDQFQQLARTQIDLELMNNRRTAVSHLLHYYPTLAELYDIALYTITARETLSPEEEAQKVAELQRFMDPKAPEHFAKSSLALAILENGGQTYVNLLLNQAMTGVVTEGFMPAELSEDELVRQLMSRHTLDELVTLTNQLTSDERLRGYVQRVAQTGNTSSTANQKATICHFLVQQLGSATIAAALDANGR
jgi:hypothetical protein